MMDDDKDGGIEVEESMEVPVTQIIIIQHVETLFTFLSQHWHVPNASVLVDVFAHMRQTVAVQQQVLWLVNNPVRLQWHIL